MSERASICPNCGAEIVFRWSGAVQTTCPACRSILVRHDLKLERVGTMGDVPPSMSRIQLGTEGQFKGTAFEVVGRIRYQFGRGHWSEWHLRMADGSSAWLSDAQGEFAVTRATELTYEPSDEVRPGDEIILDEELYTVASITNATYAGVEGELPFEYWDKTEVPFVDLKRGSDGFGTLDYSEKPPLLFLGEYESFEELRLTNLREGDVHADESGIRAKGLNCPQCGAAIELHLGQLAQTVTCAACNSVLDATDPNLAMLQSVENKLHQEKPAIPLGSEGSLKGTRWRVVGFQVRAITVDDVRYAWHEYLLWNVDAGFRYLTEYDGHWNDVAVLKGVPKERIGGDQPIVEYIGLQFKHFQRARARTEFVLGEFPWEVRVGDEAQTDDYVSPPLLLSKEVTPEEMTWSMGTYTEPQRIQQAFGLKKPLKRPHGVYVNQPNPMGHIGTAYLKTFAVLAILLVALFIGRRMTARNESVFADSYRAAAQRGAEGAPAFTTRPFDLRGRTSNVEIRIDTDLANDWAFFNLALLADDGGRGFEVGREVSYYYGVEGGESWREGSQADRVMLSGVPAGRYYLLVDVDRNVIAKPFNYELRITRDVPRTWPFAVALLLLALPAILVFVRQSTFEHTRWQESDYAAETDDDE